jgi:hypothetical protein
VVERIDTPRVNCRAQDPKVLGAGSRWVASDRDRRDLPQVRYKFFTVVVDHDNAW